MRKLLLAVFVSASMSFAATWTGSISDSMCGASHKKMLTEHKDIKTDHDCAVACVKQGAKYVFVSKGKVYQIANQDYSGLEEHAGHTVKLSGDMKGDTITVSSIAMAGKGHAAKAEKKGD